MSEDTERVTKLLNDIEVLVSDLFLGHRNFSPTEHCGRIQHALGEARHALATAEASAAAVGEKVREEAEEAIIAEVNRKGGLEGSEWSYTREERAGLRIARTVVVALPLPPGAEALAAVRREAAQKMLDHLAMNGWLDVEEDMTANRLIETALFPASGRTTTEGG